jgi:MoxR-like ATPase
MTPRESLEALRARVAKSVLGQDAVVELILLGLLADGHVLLEGVPGLAKTRAVKALAAGIDTTMRRIQFTPDLLPSDVTGSIVYTSEGGKGTFRFEQGPIFGNLVLVDEINRAPAKVQSALLEAMEERQVTVGGDTHRLPELFMVLATQNPIEQEGTYPLPEAQLDRFLLHIRVDYPSKETELAILRLVRGEETKKEAETPLPSSLVLDARRAIREGIKVAPAVEHYMVDLVTSTRGPKALDADLGRWVEIGASPRATLALDKVSRARAFVQGRDYVSPDDVRAIAPAVLRHRLGLAYEAKAKNVTPDQVVARLLDVVAVAG